MRLVSVDKCQNCTSLWDLVFKSNVHLPSLSSLKIPRSISMCCSSSYICRLQLQYWRNVLYSKGKGKCRFLELFQHWGHLTYCILASNTFPHSSPEAPRIIQMLETSTNEGGNYYQILLANSNLRKSARIFTCRKAGDMGQILLLSLRRKAYWGFSGHPKNRPGLNPRTRVPVASMLTTRPPKPSSI